MIGSVDYITGGVVLSLVIGALGAQTVSVIRALHDNTQKTKEAQDSVDAVTAQVTPSNGTTLAETVEATNKLVRTLSAEVRQHHANASIHLQPENPNDV